MISTADRPFPTYKRFLPGGISPWGVMHVGNRTAGGLFLFGPAEKEYLRWLVFNVASFCGLEVLTWTCLSNHFHLLLRVPSEDEGARLRAEVSEEEIFERMKICYSKVYIEETQKRIKRFRSTPGKEPMAEAILQRLRAQMYDISAYMHIVQRRFSAWYNQRHDRRGTLWEGRFFSSLVEESGRALIKTAAYLDLNAVRAQIVSDPKDYRWCGYGEAVAGRAESLAGLISVVRAATVSDDLDPVAEAKALEIYRDWLVELGAPVIDYDGEVLRRGFAPKVPVEAESVVNVPREAAAAPGAAEPCSTAASAASSTPTNSTFSGKLDQPALLGTRVRYFTAGLVIGSREFCEATFRRYRQQFGPKRKTGARPWRHGDWGGLCGLRDLRRNVIGHS